MEKGGDFRHGSRSVADPSWKVDGTFVALASHFANHSYSDQAIRRVKNHSPITLTATLADSSRQISVVAINLEGGLMVDAYN